MPYRYELALSQKDEFRAFSFSCTSDVKDFANEIIKANTYPEEHVWIVGIDAKGGVLGYEKVSKGDNIGTKLSLSMMLKPLLLMNASGAIIIHNHVSGDVTPSKEDITIFQNARDAGKIFGIVFIDSVIIGVNTDNYCSIANSNNAEIPIPRKKYKEYILKFVKELNDSTDNNICEPELEQIRSLITSYALIFGLNTNSDEINKLIGEIDLLIKDADVNDLLKYI